MWKSNLNQQIYLKINQFVFLLIYNSVHQYWIRVKNISHIKSSLTIKNVKSKSIQYNDFLHFQCVYLSDWLNALNRSFLFNHILSLSANQSIEF